MLAKTLLRKQLQSCLILLVDDMEFNLIVLKEILHSEGFHNIETARDGKEALEKTHALKPDLVILDLLMPKLDGFEFCRTVRQDPHLKDTPILVQTALTMPEQRTRAFEVGATDFVTKPLDAGEIIARMIVRLEHKKLFEDLQASQKRMHDELLAARSMQRLIIPDDEHLQALNESHGIEAHSCFRPSSELGGDFWGIRPLSLHRVALYMVDFSGHGVTAAFNTFRLHTLLSDPQNHEDPGQYITHLNAKLSVLLPSEHYATMFYGVWDVKKGMLRYTTAGTTSPVIIRAKENRLTVINGSGFPLSVSPRSHYTTADIPLKKGDTLLLYSDALIETEDELGNFLQEEGVIQSLEQQLLSSRHPSCKALFTHLMEKFDRDYAPRLRDDLTVAALTAH